MDNWVETVDKSVKLWKTYLNCVGFCNKIVDVPVHKGGKELSGLWMISIEIFSTHYPHLNESPWGEDFIFKCIYIRITGEQTPPVCLTDLQNQTIHLSTDSTTTTINIKYIQYDINK